MFFDNSVSKITEITNKWELAQRMLGKDRLSEEALRSIFKGAMQQLEKISGSAFDLSLKKRVWNEVSKERLKTLNETLMLEFCEKILGGFNEDEARDMLEEHKKTGSIQNIFYNESLKNAYTLNQNFIIEAVLEKANSMTDSWIPEIVEAVRKEGIQLPNPNENNK